MRFSFFGTKPRFQKTEPRHQSIKTTRSIDVGGVNISYTLTQRAGTRSLHMHVDPQKGLMVSAPRRTPLFMIENFITQKKFWITQHLKEAEKTRQKNTISTGTQITIIGVTKTIILKEQKLSRPYVAENEEHITVYSSPKQETIKQTLETYLRKKFKVHLTRRLKEISQIMNTHYGTVTIRAQKSRWGSCSYRNNLNFNWKLVLFQPEIIDYVIMHELAHTVHHNHSEKFYQLLSHHCPDYKQLRKKLHNTRTLF